MSEPSERSDPTVTMCELGAVPALMWQCPKCLVMKQSLEPSMISPVGNWQQVEWSCDCGHEGRLARSRVRTKPQNRAERKRLESLRKRQSKR